MESSEFRKQAHELVDWIADYYDQIRDYPVKSQAAPGDILKQLPTEPAVRRGTVQAYFRRLSIDHYARL